MSAAARPEFVKLNMSIPAWPDLPPLAEPWQPDPDFPIREEDLDQDMLAWNIRVRPNDLVTL